VPQERGVVIDLKPRWRGAAAHQRSAERDPRCADQLIFNAVDACRRRHTDRSHRNCTSDRAAVEPRLVALEVSDTGRGHERRRRWQRCLEPLLHHQANAAPALALAMSTGMVRRRHSADSSNRKQLRHGTTVASSLSTRPPLRTLSVRASRRRGRHRRQRILTWTTIPHHRVAAPHPGRRRHIVAAANCGQMGLDAFAAHWARSPSASSSQTWACRTWTVARWRPASRPFPLERRCALLTGWGQAAAGGRRVPAHVDRGPQQAARELRELRNALAELSIAASVG